MSARVFPVADGLLVLVEFVVEDVIRVVAVGELEEWFDGARPLSGETLPPGSVSFEIDDTRPVFAPERTVKNKHVSSRI